MNWLEIAIVDCFNICLVMTAGLRFNKHGIQHDWLYSTYYILYILYINDDELNSVQGNKKPTWILALFFGSSSLQ